VLAETICEQEENVLGRGGAMQEKAVENLPKIIHEAAQSQLGILALMVVGIGLLGYFFFAKAKLKMRVGMFLVMFAGVVAFGIAVVRTQSIKEDHLQTDSAGPGKPSAPSTAGCASTGEKQTEIAQTTKGDASPAISCVNGSVTITVNPEPKNTQPGGSPEKKKAP
jgi:hypothetical protein